MLLGDVILKYRKEHNISQRDFAKSCKLSHSYIAMLEKNIDSRTGKPIRPTLDTIKSVSQGIGCSVDDILKLLNDEQEISLSTKIDESKILGGLAADFDKLNDEQKKIIKKTIEMFLKGEK